MKWTLLAAATAVAMVLGCGATRPPNQLVDARSAYQKASVNPAAPMATTSLFEAKQALDAAERAFQEGDLTKAKNLAYIAHRKALAAEAKAETLRAVESKRVALADFQHFREMQALARREQLEREKGAQAKVQREAEAARQAREATEAKIAQLDGVQVERTDRGLVMTIAGGALFASEPKRGHEKAELLDSGKEKLSQVAKALKDDKRTILVIAHTDDRGKRDANKKLSEERAEAVRRQLASEGIDEQRVKSEGMGDAIPVADNKTKEGREENRRIEIVLEASPGSGHTEPPAKEPDEKEKKEKTEKAPPKKKR